MTEERVGDGSPGGEVVVYDAPGGEVQLNVRFDQDTVWLTQRQTAEVFVTSSKNVRSCIFATCLCSTSWTSGQLLRIP